MIILVLTINIISIYLFLLMFRETKMCTKWTHLCYYIFIAFDFFYFITTTNSFTLNKSFSRKDNCLIIFKARFNILRFTQQISEKSDTASSVQTFKDSSYSTTSYASSSQQQRYQKTSQKSQNNVINKVDSLF